MFPKLGALFLKMADDVDDAVVAAPTPFFFWVRPLPFSASTRMRMDGAGCVIGVRHCMSF